MMSNPGTIDKNTRIPYTGIPDHAFIRGTVPMTKREIRMIAAELLDIRPGHRVLDTGCGTGAMTVEMARRAVDGEVWGIDFKPEAIRLSRRNAERFQCRNVSLVTGRMPEDFHNIPVQSWDRVFIGGNGGAVREILETVVPKITPGGKVAVTALLMETVIDTLHVMEEIGFQYYEYRMVAVFRGKKMGTRHGLNALNPVYIMDGTLPDG